MAIMLWGKGLWQICMHHWTVHEKVDFPKFTTRYPARRGIFHNVFTTFDPEHRNERFTLISFMGFHAIFRTLWPFQIYIFNRK